MKRSTLLVLKPRRVAAACTLALLPVISMAAEDGAGNASGKRGATSRELEVARGGATGMVQDQWSFYGTVVAPMCRVTAAATSVAVPVFGFGVRSPYGIFLNTDHGLGWETNTMGSTFRITLAPAPRAGPQEGPGRLERCAAWATSRAARRLVSTRRPTSAR